jgi:hypothetical protein
MQVQRKLARFLGGASIVGLLAVYTFASASCYDHSPVDGFIAFAIFVGPGFLVALVGLLTRNPLRAIGASIGIGLWVLLAYYTDCVMPYQGGGASLSFVGVLLWGTPSGIAGLFFVDFISYLLKIKVVGSQDSGECTNAS